MDRHLSSDGQPAQGPELTSGLRWPSGLLVALLTLAPVAGQLPAQQHEEARRHGIFIESVDVDLVSIEVFASLDGEPLAGLAREDFEVYDDGERVEISHFSRREVGSEATEPERVGGTGAGALEAAVEERGASTADPLTVVIVVDQLFVSPASRRQVFAALSLNLDRLLGKGTQFLVVSKNPDVRIEQEFTTNRVLVRDTLDRLARVGTPDYSSEMRMVAELWEVRPEAGESRQTGPGQPAPALQTTQLDAQSAYQDARALSQRIHGDVSRSLATLHRFLDSLAGVPGRKALVYVADRLPLKPAEFLWRIWWERYGLEHGSRLGVTTTGPAELDLSASLEDLISDANANRVSFYPIGTDSDPDLSSAASRGLTEGGRPVSRAAQTAGGDGLSWLASRTGGRSAARFGAYDQFFAGLGRDLGTYYSLAWPSPHDGDGKIHRLEVRVNRPGVETRHPTEYRDKSADQRMTDRALSALALGIESNRLEVRVMVGKAKRQKQGLHALPVEIHVPMANLVLLPDRTAHHGKLSIQLVARDEKGRLSEPVVVRMPLEVAHRDIAWALSQTVDYSTEILVRAGSHMLAVGVHDDFGLEQSTVGIGFEVGGSK